MAPVKEAEDASSLALAFAVKNKDMPAKSNNTMTAGRPSQL
jgi:hypothetical protein